jgi:membrane-bound serine protease (ClpP class)
MIKHLLIVLITFVVLFEVIEHVLIPLIGYVLSRNKKPVTGAEAMVGKVAEVRLWHKNKGQVFVSGELWRAVCGVSMVRGDKAIIRDVEGLTLKVEPVED